VCGLRAPQPTRISGIVPRADRLLVQRSAWSTDGWAARVTDALVAAPLRDA